MTLLQGAGAGRAAASPPSANLPQDRWFRLQGLGLWFTRTVRTSSWEGGEKPTLARGRGLSEGQVSSRGADGLRPTRAAVRRVGELAGGTEDGLPLSTARGPCQPPRSPQPAFLYPTPHPAGSTALYQPLSCWQPPSPSGLLQTPRNLGSLDTRHGTVAPARVLAGGGREAAQAVNPPPLTPTNIQWGGRTWCRPSCSPHPHPQRLWPTAGIPLGVLTQGQKPPARSEAGPYGLSRSRAKRR